jgi:dCTP deaminase
MVLPDFKLRIWAKNGGITPFDESLINPASIDLRLGRLWLDIERPDVVIEADSIILYPKSASVDCYNKLASALNLPRKPTAILATTYERVRIPPTHTGSIKLKTTPSRKGLGHPIADWVDPGFEGELTLMLHAHKPIELHYKMRAVQIVIFYMGASAKRPYAITGHYQGQTGPTVAWDNRMIVRCKCLGDKDEY